MVGRRLQTGGSEPALGLYTKVSKKAHAETNQEQTKQNRHCVSSLTAMWVARCSYVAIARAKLDCGYALSDHLGWKKPCSLQTATPAERQIVSGKLGSARLLRAEARTGEAWLQPVHKNAARTPKLTAIPNALQLDLPWFSQPTWRLDLSLAWPLASAGLGPRHQRNTHPRP